MKCLYINLDAAQIRRESLEASFRAHAPSGWDLVRSPALGPDDVRAEPGAITPKEKACWRSHQAAIRATLDDPEDVLVVEDDTRFGPRTFEMLERVRAANLAWDLLFTEIIVRVEDMLGHAQRYPTLVSSGQLSVNDLAGVRFTAAAGYMVRGAAKAKLAELLDGVAQLDRPYDLHLQDLIHAKRIRALYCFPFITQPSPFAEDSQIQPDAYQLRDQAHLAFRRLMCLDRDLDLLHPQIERLEAAHGERGATMVGKVLGAFVSEAMGQSAPAGGGPPQGQ